MPGTVSCGVNLRNPCGKRASIWSSVFRTERRQCIGMAGLSVTYTEEEYEKHIAAIIRLVQREKNFHLALLPQTPFQDIQIVTQKDAVIVLRSQEPYAAFVFRNTELTESVSDYLVMLMEQHAEDRRTTVEMLDKLKFSTADRE